MIRRFGTILLLCVVGPSAAVAACGNGTKSGFDTPSTPDAALADASIAEGGSLFGNDGPGETLVISPPNPTITATGSGGTQQFTASINGSPVTAQWTLDGANVGTIGTSGLFKANGQLGGQFIVEAQSGTLHATTLITVELELSDNPGNVPPSTQGSLTGGGSADAAMAWLYPYDGTVFPRGLLPPTLQFAGTAPDATYVHISFGTFDYKGFYGASNPGQVSLPAALWTTLTETATGSDTVQVQVTKISGGQVTGPITESLIIAQGSLKGTVYYESRYSTPTDNGATMAIHPGATAPSVLFGNCVVCHYVSADGSTIVATERNATPFTSATYDLKDGGALVYQAPNEVLTFGALYPDGTVLMANAAMTPDPGGWPPDVPGVGDEATYPSRLYDTKTGANIPASGWDSTITNALMPAFAPDGKSLAFNHYDTGMGHSLAVMGFDRKTNSFSGLVDFATDATSFLGWPSFTPDGQWVVYENDNRPDYATWSAVESGNGSDAKADLQIAYLPNQTTASLDELNGVRNGQYYLPFGETAEGHMNYDASVLPVAVGGYYWVVFTSRREYGNTINTSDPYYNTDNQTPGALPWRKKLWVAALDISGGENTTTGAHDISHPAFYLPGQDLQTGNYRGFWALEPCQANGTSCSSGDECCSGFCRQTTIDGGSVTACVVAQGCANEYEKCTTSSDCCQASKGYQCINGYCAEPSAQ